MKLNLILLVAALSFTGFSAVQAADDETYYSRNSAGYIIYEHTPTYETFITRNANNDRTYERTHYFADDAAPKPTPVVPAATNSSHVARSTAPVQTPIIIAVVTQAPVTVVSGTMTPEEIQRLVNGK
jgi:hypothetical protein